jgi:hypothetical protein
VHRTRLKPAGFGREALWGTVAPRCFREHAQIGISRPRAIVLRAPRRRRKLLGATRDLFFAKR